MTDDKFPEVSCVLINDNKQWVSDGYERRKGRKVERGVSR